MGVGDLPGPVRSLIARHIGSALDLEILLKLHGDGGTWQPAAVARELRTDPTATEATLQRLAGGRLLARGEAGYSFSPATADLERAVGALAESHARNRVKVIEFIYKQPSDRISTFSDAFRFRQD